MINRPLTKTNKINTKISCRGEEPQAPGADRTHRRPAVSLPGTPVGTHRDHHRVLPVKLRDVFVPAAPLRVVQRPEAAHHLHPAHPALRLHVCRETARAQHQHAGSAPVRSADCSPTAVLLQQTEMLTDDHSHLTGPSPGSGAFWDMESVTCTDKQAGQQTRKQIFGFYFKVRKLGKNRALKNDVRLT